MKSYKIYHLLSDIFFINIAFALANFIIFQTLWVDGWAYPSLLFVVNIAAIISHFLAMQNQINASYSYRFLFYNTLEYIFVIAFFVLIYWFVIHSLKYSRLHISSFFIISFILLFYSKTYYIGLLRKYNLGHIGLENTIVIGSNIYAKKFVNNLIKNKWTGFNFIGFLSEDGKGNQVLGKLEDIESVCKKLQVKNVFINLPDIKLLDDQYIKLRDFSERNLIKVMVLSQIHHQHLKSSYHMLVGDYPIVYLYSMPLDGLKNKLIKRMFDIIFSLLFCVFVLSWLSIIVAILIKLESKGPVFYFQRRQGKDNKMFSCFKFRTMYYNPTATFSQTVKNDSRITKVGAILRKTNIDEMPQFLNVLLGDMSIVGPRPHVLEHNIEFAEVIDKFYARHMFKPGVTGLAQVKGFRGEITSHYKMAGRVKLDRYYIYNWSFWFDMKIVWLTIKNTILGDPNAY